MKFVKLNIKSKFRIPYECLDRLDSKVNEKEGFIFKNHTYSQEQLIDSPEHHRIYSVTQKIGSDLQLWYKLGQITSEQNEEYLEERGEIEYRLDNLNDKIKFRKPTLWEKIKQPLAKFMIMIMNSLPESLRATILNIASTKMLPFLKDISSKIVKKLPLLR